MTPTWCGNFLNTICGAIITASSVACEMTNSKKVSSCPLGLVSGLPWLDVMIAVSHAALRSIFSNLSKFLIGNGLFEAPDFLYSREQRNLDFGVQNLRYVNTT